MTMHIDGTTVALIGGTGKEGRGLAFRWCKAGYQVFVGSRSEERATSTANELGQLVPGSRVYGVSNVEAAEKSANIVLTVPYSAHRETLEMIRAAMGGKLLVDATVPLVSGRVTRVQMPPAGSAAQEAREILGDGVEVAAAFHTISHELLLGDEPIDCDVLVTGTSADARDRALALVAAAGLRGWDAGPLENSSVSEGLTSVLIHINKKYGSRRAGIVITRVRGV